MSASTAAYTAVGRAVCAAQMFEIVLLVAFEVFRMITEPEYRKLTGGMIAPTKFKTPTKNLLKFLAERNDIAPELEAQIAQLLEDRHTVVHRWVLQRGLAAPEEAAYWQEYQSLALRVEAESRRISRVLLSYILKYGASDLAATDHAEFVARMQQLFQNTNEHRLPEQ
jgi:hypothetical protein